MVLSKEHRIFSRSFAQVDSSNDDDIIRGVSLITKGEAKGHGCQIDDETLSTLLECAKKFKTGVRANLGHFTGVEKAFGFINNLRIQGEKLVGDLNLFPEFSDYKLVKKQLATIADTIGFSVFFDGPDEEREEEIEGAKVKVAFARCSDLYSADLVDCPAANPSGVFDRRFISGPTARGQIDESTVDAKKVNMAEDTKEAPDLKKEISDMLAKHADHMSKMNDRMDEMCERLAIGTDDTPVKSDKGAADLEKEEGKDKDSSPENPGGSAMEDEGGDKGGAESEENKEEDKKIEKKDLSRKTAARALAKPVTAVAIVDELLGRYAMQKKSPPASATVSSPTDERALSNSGKSKFKTFQEACRSVLAANEKLTKTQAMNQAIEQHPELYKAYTKAQENGESWTREALFMTPEKHQRRLSIIANGGRLT